MNSLEKKTLYFKRFDHLFSEYSRIILVNIENISSNQFKKCRKSMGKHSILILGKNKIIKKVLNEHLKKKPELSRLLPFLSGNVGFIFTKMEPLQIKKILLDNKVPAEAKVGQIASDDVTIPAGITNISPDGTSFFQALNIQTKISKGLIEIQNQVKIITKGEQIGNSEVNLLQKLNIIPFSHSLEIKLVYENGFCVQPNILEISMNDIEKKLNDTKQDLKILESLISYSNFIKMENQVKKTTLDLTYLLQILGLNRPLGQKKKDIEHTKTLLDNCNEKTDERGKIVKKCDTEEEEEDLGFGLFD